MSKDGRKKNKRIKRVGVWAQKIAGGEEEGNLGASSRQEVQDLQAVNYTPEIRTALAY